MNPIKEDKMIEASINFDSSINEQYLKSFAHKVEEILKAMLTGRHAPVSIKGEKNKVEAFARALGIEEKYIKTLQDSSPTEPQVMKVRHQLESEIANFEETTGIKWPVR
jgi:hypothetical protein